MCFCLSAFRSTFSFHSKQQRSYFPEVSRLIKQVSKLHISAIFKDFSCLLAKTSSIDSNRRPQYKLEKYKRSSVRSSNFKRIGGITKKIQRFENLVERSSKSLFWCSRSWSGGFPGRHPTTHIIRAHDFGFRSRLCYPAFLHELL